MRVALILVGLSTLAVMEFETPPRTTRPVNEPPAQASVGSSDTLTTSDRLENPQMLQTPLQPVSSSEAIPRSDQPSIVALGVSKIVEQNKRSVRTGKSSIVPPKVRPGHRASKVTVSRATANKAA